MSAIAGLLRFDKQTVTQHELERAANALRQYGPDRSGVLASGNIGLAHVLMGMTPEDRLDRQPLHGATGSMITADLRLDNRDDVLARIGIAPRQAAEWPDSRVLLAAWEKLGDDIWSMLRGPFAAAIWDPRSSADSVAPNWESCHSMSRWRVLQSPQSRRAHRRRGRRFAPRQNARKGRRLPPSRMLILDVGFFYSSYDTLILHR